MKTNFVVYILYQIYYFTARSLQNSPLVKPGRFLVMPTGTYMVGRDGIDISEITIHHTATVVDSIEEIYTSWINSGRAVSSHYCVKDNDIVQFVKECNTAYTNGGDLWDPTDTHRNHRAVTIETCNCAETEDWPVSDASLETLIALVADIARRNNLGKLVVGQNLKGHSHYANTLCPGPYLADRMQEIADRANAINDEAVFIRKLGTQYPLVLTSTASNEGYGVAFSETVSESNQKWIIKDTAEGKEIINAFDTTQNLRLNSTNDVFVVSSNASLSKAYLVPGGDSSEQFIIQAAINGLSRATSFKWLTISDGSLVATALEALAEWFDKTPKSDVASSLIQPSYYSNMRFKIKKGENYLTFVPSENSFSFAVKNNDIAQIFEIENRVDGAVITSLADSSKYLSLKASDNTFSTMLPLFEMRSVSPNISFVPYTRDGSSNKYFIRSSRYNKCLGIDEDNKLIWAGFDLETRDNFIWELEEPGPKPINDWLVAYYNPIRTENKKIREIPDYAMRFPSGVTEEMLTADSNLFDGFINSSYIDEKGRLCITSYVENSLPDNGKTTKVTVSFTNRKDWATKERKIEDYPIVPENVKNIVSNCIGITIDNESSQHYLESGAIALYNEINGEKYYWVALGPNVIFDEYPANRALDSTGKYSYYDRGVVDAVISDDNGILYYVRCLIGDSKAHTWSNGFFQTDFSYMTITQEENESDENYYHRLYKLKNHNYQSVFDYRSEPYAHNYCVCVEFMGSAPITGTKAYTLNNFIYYPFSSSDN